MANGRNDLQMPKTRTPGSVWWVLAGLAGLMVMLLCALLSPLIFNWGWFLGVIVSFVIFGFTTNYYTETVPGFFARILLNQLTGTQRTIFQGLHPKLPWESITRDVDLRVDLKDVLSETYASLDALMETKYVYTMRPQLTGGAVILYASYESEALKQSIRSLLSMLLSDYYGKHNGPQLLDKLLINREVFEYDSEGLIARFEKEHGVAVTARLEDSDFDAATQAARDTVSRAKSFSDAVQKLVDGGMDRVEAEKVAKLMNLPGVQEYIVSLKAEGVENLRDFTILGGLGGQKGGKK
jgi:hypothetical protein